MSEYAWAVRTEGELATIERGSGLRETPLIGRAEGALHFDSGLVELEPGVEMAGHIHAYEESFYVLEGDGFFSIADRVYSLGPGGFGHAPVGVAHGWRNAGDRPLRWLRTRAPQPRLIGSADGTYPASDHRTDPASAVSPDVPRGQRAIGTYGPDEAPRPGPIQMKGFRAAASNVGVWMMVDEVSGAVHHTKFSVRFDPTEAGMTLGGQHYHPFEEAYYVTHGSAVAHLEDQAIEVGAGDVVFAGVNTLHGFTNPTTEPVRWIEIQAPVPPPTEAFFFAADWQ